MFPKNDVEPELNDLDWEKLLACAKEIEPLLSQIVKLISTFKDNEFSTALSIVIKIFPDGKQLSLNVYLFSKKRKSFKSTWLD